MRDAEDGVRIMTSGFGRVNEVELMRAQREQRNIKKRRGRNKLICSKKKKEHKIEERKDLAFVHRLLFLNYIACFCLILVSFFPFVFPFSGVGQSGEPYIPCVTIPKSPSTQTTHMYSYTHARTHTHTPITQLNENNRWEK